MICPGHSICGTLGQMITNEKLEQLHIKTKQNTQLCLSPASETFDSLFIGLKLQSHTK